MLLWLPLLPTPGYPPMPIADRSASALGRLFLRSVCQDVFWVAFQILGELLHFLSRYAAICTLVIRSRLRVFELRASLRLRIWRVASFRHICVN